MADWNTWINPENNWEIIKSNLKIKWVRKNLFRVRAINWMSWPNNAIYLAI